MGVETGESSVSARDILIGKLEVSKGEVDSFVPEHLRSQRLEDQRREADEAIEVLKGLPEEVLGLMLPPKYALESGYSPDDLKDIVHGIQEGQLGIFEGDGGIVVTGMSGQWLRAPEIMVGNALAKKGCDVKTIGDQWAIVIKRAAPVVA